MHSGASTIFVRRGAACRPARICEANRVVSTSWDVGVSYTGSTHDLGSCRLGSIPSTPTREIHMVIFKADKFKKARGGYSRLLDISCAKCRKHLCYYQKDGPGILKRLYIDRMHGNINNKKELVCSKCKRLLGIRYIYEKEKRPAFRLFVGAISKKILKSGNI